MTGFELPVALFLLANLAASLWRVLRGPGDANRLLAVLLFGSTGVGILALLAFAGLQTATPLIDVALTLALLAAITAIAFAQRAWRQASSSEQRDD
jgi:multicomponent Na+:H+ antiporter subunit F